MIDSCGKPILLEIDGGVNTENAKRLSDAGVDVMVAGNAVMSAEDPKSVIEYIHSLKRD